MKVGRRRGRVLAFQALYAWDVGNIPAADLLDFSWYEKNENENSDDLFLFPRLLFLSALEHIEEIDAAIKPRLKHWDFDRITRVDKAVLRLGTYSLLFQHEVVPQIIINEAVNLARMYGTDDSFRFVNAVLDSIKKECLELSYEDTAQ
ncbi:MAG: transcription antitermination factor NusB [Treponema sp.]